MYIVYGGLLPAWADAMLDAAAQGQSTGMQVLGGAVSNMPSVSTQNPTYDSRTSPNMVYLPEILPGIDPEQLSNLDDYGQAMSSNPRQIHEQAMGRWFDLHRVGCRQTSIVFVGQQTTLRAYRTLRHDKTGAVSPFDEPWTLSLGKYPTLGVSKVITNEQRYDDNHTLVTIIELSPFPQPRDGSYFTYDHQITTGDGIITSYGNLEDGFSSKGSVQGASLVTIRASLYRIDRTYLRNPDDNSPPASCPQDPPDPCYLGGVNWCDPKAAAIGPLVMSGSSRFGDANVYDALHGSLILQHETQPMMDLTDDASVVQGVGTTHGAMTGTDPMVASLFSGCTVVNTVTSNEVVVHEAEIHTCSGVYTGVDTCEWTRKFDFSKNQTKDILTVVQYCKTGTPPTYQPCAISHVPTMECPGGGPLSECTFGYPSTWHETIDNATYLEYRYTPFTPSQNAFTWNDTSSCSLGAEKCVYTSNLYVITENAIAGCDVYTMMLWDGWCHGNVTCTDYRSCMTIEDVTFCEGDPASAKIIEKMETKPYPATHPSNPEQPIYSPMCWAGGTEPMTCEYFIGQGECYTDPQGQVHCPETTGYGFTQHEELCPGPPELCPYFQDDCEHQGLYGNPECTYIGIECAEGSQGAYSGICYVPDIQYDCGGDLSYEVPNTSATAQICASPLRCLGTECHNVRGETNADMGYAVSALTGIELMQNDLVCGETGEPPTEAQIQSGECSIMVFDGKHLECQVPAGDSDKIGVPNCCKEGLKAASGINAFTYIQLAFHMVNLAKNPIVLEGLASIPGASPVFELFENVGNLYSSAVSALKTTVTNAFTSAVEHLGSKIGSKAAEESAKKAISSMSIASLKQKLMWKAYDYISETFGPELANKIFTVIGTEIALNAVLSTVIHVFALIYTVYSITKILMQIIFACHESELKLGIERKLGKCTFVGSYCSDRVLFYCITKKESYCCYNTPLARIIMEQARRQLGGFGSKKHPNCQGLTPQEMQSVNWDAIDLTEWTARLAEAGILPQSLEQAEERWGATNIQHLQREYGISETVGPDGDFTKAESNKERLEPFVPVMIDGKQELETQPYGYVEPEEMPQYRPESPPPPGTDGYITPP